MKANTLLVDVSRGGVVNQDALVTALEENMIAGAALDVFPEEPLPEDHPLWGFSNVIISPHIAGFSAHYNQRAINPFSKNVELYLNKQPLLNVVDVQRGY
jgi:phosphoglycerate dehydrogenase-like enzyme